MRAIAWVTMASRVKRRDLHTIAEPSQPMALARFARTISAIAYMRAAFYVFYQTDTGQKQIPDKNPFGSILFSQVGLAKMHPCHKY